MQVTKIHRPARLATRAASFRYGGRHHSGIPGAIISLYPGAFVVIRTLSAMSNGIRIFRPFYISLDNAYPNSRLRSTSSRLSAHEEADPRDWLVRPGRDALIVQTLSQSRGHATTLLALDVAGSDEDDL